MYRMNGTRHRFKIMHGDKVVLILGGYTVKNAVARVKELEKDDLVLKLIMLDPEVVRIDHKSERR